MAYLETKLAGRKRWGGRGGRRGKAEEKASTDHGKTIWVRPWDQLQLPAVPGAFGLNEAFVLQALLLHDGLPDSLLPRLLPLMPFAIAGSIKQLQIANLVTDEIGCRRVTSLGYVAVRGFLHDEGFLTDDSLSQLLLRQPNYDT